MEDQGLTDQIIADMSSARPDRGQNAKGDAAADNLLPSVLSSLNDDKAEEIVTFDLAGKSAMADHMVIASGRSSRQVQSIAENLVQRLKEDFGRLCRVEGKTAGDWVLIDVGDVIIHLFRPEVREFYQLEKMWSATPDKNARNEAGSAKSAGAA